MSNKFLTTSTGSINLSNGTVDIFAESLGADNLEASRPLRTNAVKKIVSSNLDISDINDLQSELTTKQELTFVNNDSHTNPPSGQTKLYVKSDGTFYKLDENGNEQNIGGSGYELIPTNSNTLGIHYEAKYDKTTWLDTGYMSTDYNLYNYFSSAIIPSRNISTSTQTTTTPCSTETDLDTAIANQQGIIITNSFTLTTQKTINYPVLIRTDGNWHTLTGDFNGALFTISSDNSLITNIELVNTNTGSNCTCINFSSTTALNNTVFMAYFQTNESAIWSANAQIAIEASSFTFVGTTPDSHRYIFLSRTTGTTQILNNTFRANGDSTPSTACVFFTGQTYDYSGGTFIFSNNTSDGTAIQRVGIMETLPSQYSDFKMYFTNNTILTNTDFFILYGDDFSGISEIVLSNNNVTLIPTSVGFKGLIGIDKPSSTPVAIQEFPRVRASLNALPTTVRSDYEPFPKCTTDFPIVCYRAVKFSHEMEVNVEPPLVYTYSGGGGGGGVTNPYVGTLIVSDLETDDTFSLNQEIQKISNISSATNNPDITNFDGEIHVAKIKSASHNTEIEFEQTGDMSLTTDGVINITSGGDTSITTVNNDIQLTASEIRLNSTTLTANGQTVLTKDINPIAIGNSAGLINQTLGAVAIGDRAGVNDQSVNAVAIGKDAGENNQGGSSVAVGALAGENNQGAISVAIGIQAGQNNQGGNAIAIGTFSAQNTQGQYAVAIGYNAGRTNQAGNALAIGNSAGSTNQGASGIAIGQQAGQSTQGGNAVAIGNASGQNNQGQNAVAIGIQAGQGTQGINSIAIGLQSGQTQQQVNSLAIGQLAGQGLQGTASIAIGQGAAWGNQGARSIAIGQFAGQTNQGEQGIAIGRSAGVYFQQTGGVAIGISGGQNNQGQNAVAIGNSAGQNTQGLGGIAIGSTAGQISQKSGAIAIGISGGQNNQDQNAVAIGNSAGQNTQGQYAVAIGYNAGRTNQGGNALAIGNGAGSTNQGGDGIAIGRLAGQSTQGGNAVAIGNQAGSVSQQANSVALGVIAGQQNQGSHAVAIGHNAGNINQGGYSVAIGDSAGNNQGVNAIAIGKESGQTQQGNNGIAMGYRAGQSTQGDTAVAIGKQAGSVSQQANSVALGVVAGEQNQGAFSVALGCNAGNFNQGNYSIAIGNGAGNTSLPANAICLNASSSAFSPTTEGVFMSSIKNKAGTVSTKPLMYDSTTKELHTGGTVNIDQKLQLTTYTNSAPSVGDLWKDGDDLKFQDSTGTETIAYHSTFIGNTGFKVYKLTGVFPSSGNPTPVSLPNNLTYSDILQISGNTVTTSVTVPFTYSPVFSKDWKVDMYINNANNTIALLIDSTAGNVFNQNYVITIIATT